MRRLGDLWEDGDPYERKFVKDLLLHIADGTSVTDNTWRVAGRLWEKTVQDQIDLQKPWPEVKAMIFLTTITSAAQKLRTPPPPPPPPEPPPYPPYPEE
jgi:hypothetical protein